FLRLKPLAAGVLIGLPAVFATDVSAQERRVPAGPNEVRLSYAPVVQRAAPSVVNVYAARVVANRNPFMDDPIFQRFFGAPGGGQTVTHGIVSAVARTQVGITDYQFFIQTDAAVNPGNSGGALVDISGNLVGINTAIFSRSGGSQGIGFAIPANMVRVVVASAKSGGKAVKRPWLGARLQAVTPEIAETLGLRLPNGALVANVAPNSPAARAGLKL